MPIFRLSLAKTYYEQGFFNVTIDFDRYVGSTGPVELVLRKSGVRFAGKINRRANPNGTPRIMGGAQLRDWFQSNYHVGDVIDVDLGSTNSIGIG